MPVWALRARFIFALLMVGLVKVLFVNVSAPVKDAKVRVPVGTVIVPLFDIEAITGAVKVLLVRTSVVALPTKVSLLVAGNVSVLVPATAVACTVVVPEVDPLNAKDVTGEALLRKNIRSSDVNTCLTDAPAVCATPDTPGLPVPA